MTVLDELALRAPLERIRYYKALDQALPGFPLQVRTEKRRRPFRVHALCCTWCMGYTDCMGYTWCMGYTNCMGYL